VNRVNRVNKSLKGQYSLDKMQNYTVAFLDTFTVVKSTCRFSCQ